MSMYDDEKNMMEEEDFHEYHAQIETERHCTDIPCCILFLLYCFGMVGIGVYAFQNGDLKKASHMYDYNGELCGVDEDVKNEPYLYWCPKEGSTIELNLNMPVCVSSCPTSVEYSTYCPEYQPGGFVGPERLGTYSSKMYADKFCLPDSPLLKASLLGNTTAFGPFEHVTNAVDSLRHGWVILVTAFITSFLAGFTFLVMLRTCAKPVVYLTILAVIGFSIGFGTYFVYRAQDALNEPIENHEKEALGNSRTYELYLGYVLIGFGVLFFFISCCCCRNAIETAIAIVQESTHVIFSMPALLMQPAAEVVIKGAGTLALIYLLLYLATCGEMKSESMQVGTYEVKGIYRKFEWTDNQKVMLGYWILGIFWFQELLTAIGLFIIAYATVLWYFTPKDPGTHEKDIPMSTFPILRGLKYAFVYHMGSLAFGSFIIAVCRFIQFVLGMLAKQAHAEGNPVMEAVAKCLACVIECFKRTMEFLNKNAYIDMAIHSNNFCPAAWEAMTLILSNGGRYAFLNGAVEVIKWIGIFLIALVGVVVSFFLTKMDMFSEETSDHFLESPYAVIIVAGIISLVVSTSFMLVYDMVADTLLYCFCDSTNKNEVAVFCPDSLLALMQDDHDTSCC